MDAPSESALATRLERFTDGYGLVLALIIATLILMASLGQSAWTRPITLLLLGATLVVTLRASGISPRIVRLVAVGLVPALVLVSLLVLVGLPSAAKPINGAFATALAIVAPVVIFRRLVGHAAITMKTILGALCIYLLIGFFFAFVYQLMDAVGSQPFFAQTAAGAHAKVSDLLYFSYATLTTVGYGDLSPVGGLGKSLSVTEALLGQLYLVTIVALLVGNLGRTRTPGADDA